MTIPFELVNNLIVVPITINKTLKLKFIVDTGATNPILTESLFAEIIGLDFDRTINISGPGLQDSILAYVANEVKMQLPYNVIGNYMSLLVLEKDYIQLKKNLGEDIFGIIGYDIFSRFVVRVDYDKQELTLIDPSVFEPPKRGKFVELPLKIERTKPYLEAVVTQGSEKDTLKFMIDTGASHALLLDIHNSDVLHYPDTTILAALGHGLGGIIPGRIGRFNMVNIDKFYLNNVLVSIPFEGAYSNIIKRGSRNGTIGGNILSHFEVIFDYTNEKIYIREGDRFREPFEYDMSGMTLSVFEEPERLVITEIIPGGPAEKAGLEVGMEIKRVNSRNLKNSSLSAIYGLLRSAEDKRITVKIVDEEGNKVKYKFRLKRLI